jgi:hypothetical protein
MSKVIWKVVVITIIANVSPEKKENIIINMLYNLQNQQNHDQTSGFKPKKRCPEAHPQLGVGLGAWGHVRWVLNLTKNQAGLKLYFIQIQSNIILELQLFLSKVNQFASKFQLVLIWKEAEISLEWQVLLSKVNQFATMLENVFHL